MVIEPADFRKVLGAYPTGVCLVTARHDDGERTGMIVGSFTSISLDPPLVGFFADKGGRSWQALSRSDSFCVNVLRAEQIELCRHFSRRGDDKFAGLAHGSSPGGHPLFGEALAWLECAVERTDDIGDHILVVGRVKALGRAEGTGAPLLFCAGAFHSTGPLEAVA